jgi:deoxyribodipyrimidine photolyase-related protein
MAQMYRTWDRMKEDHRDTVISDAEDLLRRLDKGEVI